jgi:hypothetical protein
MSQIGLKWGAKKTIFQAFQSLKDSLGKLKLMVLL